MKNLIRLKESRAVRPVVSAKQLGRVYLTAVFAAAVLVLTAAVLTAGAVAAGHTGAVVKLGQSSLGRILVDSHGRTLYLWAHDKRGKSTCYGACATYWPPLITRGKPRAISGARSGLVGTTRRRDGKLQVTYHGHPLYRFSLDRRAGQTAGEGLSDFGGRWYAVSAAGNAVGKPTGYSQRSYSQRVHGKLRHGLLTIEGTDASDRIALRLEAGRPDILQVDVGDDGSADFSFKRKHIREIAVDARAGDDLVRIDEANGVFTDTIPTALNGGDGNDNVAGGSGAETLLGGDGNDSIDGNGANDLALLGAGDDTFVWDPGDGSDTVEGQEGADRMLFNGANVPERVDLSANGNRLEFFRDPGRITMDTVGVERVDFNALGGADLVTVNDLTGTDVKTVNTDLGGTTGDPQTDQVTVNGTNGNDKIDVAGDATGVTVTGLATLIAIQHQEPNDKLDVDGLGGVDTISAAALAAQAITLSLDGGAADDTIAGAQGVETAFGGSGNDSIDGNGGNDVAFLGAGEDTFVWDPGDGSDTVEGQEGADRMLFKGANGAEQVDLSANGNRLRFFRTQGTVTMDTAGIEIVDFNALGGADLVTVNDLSGTDVTELNVELAGTLGGATGDGQADRVVVNATNNDDTIKVSGDATEVTAKGLAPTLAILHPEAANDRLEINTLAGNDTVDSSGLAAGAIQLFVDGVLVP